MRLAFSSLACPGWTVEEIVRAADRYGYEGIEWRLADGALLGPRTEDVVWDAIKECGVRPACLDTSCVFVQADDEGREGAVGYAIAMAERAAAIGAPSIRVFGGAIPDDTTRSDVLEPTAQALTAAAGRMPDGVALLVETHDAWSRASDMAGLVGATQGVGVVWDVAHTYRAGESPRESLEHIGVPGLVHVKDTRGEALTHLGEGDVPLAEAISELRNVGYDGWLSLEWEKLWHPELDDPDVALPLAQAALQALVADD
ncbi:MAG: sugar phosphate isomerase/epimerase [Actinomycetota bacterium]